MPKTAARIPPKAFTPSLSLNSKSNGDKTGSARISAPTKKMIPTSRFISQSRNVRLLQPSRKPSRQVGALPVSSISSTIRYNPACAT